MTATVVRRSRSSPAAACRASPTQIFVGLVARHRAWRLLARVSASRLRPLADLFLRMIKMIIAPLLFSTLVVGIAGTGDLKTSGASG